MVVPQYRTSDTSPAIQIDGDAVHLAMFVTSENRRSRGLVQTR